MAAATAPTTIEKLRSLRWSIGGNALNAIFIQFTYFGSAFILFLDQLGMDKTDIGFILSLIPFSNLLSLFLASTIVRFGYKRTFLTFWTLRKVVTSFLLLTPWVVGRFGPQTALWFVSAVVGTFAVVRVVEETSYYPWYLEFVPDAVRGKYAASSGLATAVAGILAVWAASYVIEHSRGLQGFMGLIAAGVLFGLISAWMYSFVPGGVKPDTDPALPAQRHSLGATLRDHDFVRFLFGVSLITLGTVPLTSFLPLYLQEFVGLGSGAVLIVQVGTLLGTVCSSYFWGWAADRYGGRPVMLAGIALLIVTALLWWLLPRQLAWPLHAAIAVAFIQGLANIGWGIGSGRLLFVGIVPPAQKAEYLAVFFAWAGVVAGISQVLGGWILDTFPIAAQSWFSLPVNSYTPLILLGMALPLASLLFFGPVRSDGNVSIGQFANLFVRGNPFAAMRSLFWFHMITDEQTTILSTAQMGRTNSPLTVEELLLALRDPRFNVRFEAIISIARMRPDPRFVEALAHVLEGNSPALSVVAAWALGRLGHQDALPPLRHGLTSHYRSVRAHSARSLGTLGDPLVAGELMESLKTETDVGLQLAYASALGRLQAYAATPELLALLGAAEDEIDRLEMTLALARLLDNERYCIQTWRSMESDPGTALASAVERVAKALRKGKAREGQTLQYLEAAVAAFAGNDLPLGVAEFGRALQPQSFHSWREEQMQILQECIDRMAQHGETRLEYPLLLLTLLTCKRHTAPSANDAMPDLPRSAGWPLLR